MSLQDEKMSPKIPERPQKSTSEIDSASMPSIPSMRPVRTRTTSDIQKVPNVPLNRPRRRRTEQQLDDLVRDANNELEQMRAILSRQSREARQSKEEGGKENSSEGSRPGQEIDVVSRKERYQSGDTEGGSSLETASEVEQNEAGISKAEHWLENESNYGSSNNFSSDRGLSGTQSPVNVVEPDVAEVVDLADEAEDLPTVGKEFELGTEMQGSADEETIESNCQGIHHSEESSIAYNPSIHEDESAKPEDKASESENDIHEDSQEKISNDLTVKVVDAPAEKLENVNKGGEDSIVEEQNDLMKPSLALAEKNLPKHEQVDSKELLESVHKQSESPVALQEEIVQKTQDFASFNDTRQAAVVEQPPSEEQETLRGNKEAGAAGQLKVVKPSKAPESPPGSKESTDISENKKNEVGSTRNGTDTDGDDLEVALPVDMTKKKDSAAEPVNSDIPMVPQRPKKVPPKKPSSKIAAFQEMLKQQQLQDSTKLRGKQSDAGKLFSSGQRANIASNLNSIFGQPAVGMELSPKVPAKEVDKNTSGSESPEKASQSQVESAPNIPQRRARGPRGRKLPAHIANVEKVESHSKVNDIQVLKAWTVQFCKLPPNHSKEDVSPDSDASSVRDESYEECVEPTLSNSEAEEDTDRGRASNSASPVASAHTVIQNEQEVTEGLSIEKSIKDRSGSQSSECEISPSGDETNIQ